MNGASLIKKQIYFMSNYKWLENKHSKDVVDFLNKENQKAHQIIFELV